MLHLFLPGGQLGLGAAVDDGDLRAQTACAAGRVHGHVAAAHHRHLPTPLDGGGAAGLVGLHEIDAGQKFVGGVHALPAFAGNAHEFGQTRAAADEHGLEAVFPLQLVDGQGLADDHVGLNIHAQRLQVLDLPAHNALGQAELGDAVHQHAARQMQGLEYRDSISLPRQFARAAQAGGAGADHCYLVAVGRGTDGLFRGVGAVPVGHETLQPADGHRFTLDAADAAAFALAFLRADPAADRGQGRRPGKDLVCAFEIPLGHLVDKGGNVDADRTAAHAGPVAAVQAALCLRYGLFLSVAQRHLVKIAAADLRLLNGHGRFLFGGIMHRSSPP